MAKEFKNSAVDVINSLIANNVLSIERLFSDIRKNEQTQEHTCKAI